MEISDILDFVLITIFFKFLWAYKKVMAEQQMSWNASENENSNTVFYSLNRMSVDTTGESSEMEVAKPLTPKPLLESNENFATSTPTLRSEIGKKILKDHFIKNVPQELDTPMSKLNLVTSKSFNFKEEELSLKLENLSIKSNKLGRSLGSENLLESSDNQGAVITILSPESRKRNEKLFNQLFHPGKKICTARKSIRI